jgi:glycine cleavage system H protein
MNIPEELCYTKEHEWARMEGDLCVIGITDYAQGELGDIVYVELPEPGTQVEIMGEFGVVESVKTASDLYSPIAGEIVEVNDELADSPELVNDSPYGEGWMLKIRPSNLDEDWETLLDADGYKEVLAESGAH